MYGLGLLLAASAGLMFSAAAAMQKRQAVRTDASLIGLLPALLLRRAWLLAILLELIAWTALAAAFARAPIAAVVPVMGAGTALLLVLGIRVLEERFGPGEVLGVILAVGGGALAAAVARGPASRSPLPAGTQWLIAGIAAVAAIAIAQVRTGIGYGLAAGALYAATAVYTKEIGDGFAAHGRSAIGLIARSPTPWLLVVLSVAALTLVQAGFREANAASVVAAMTALDTAGPILAASVLYHERVPHGPAGPLLVVGIVAAVGGIALLARETSPLRPVESMGGPIPPAPS